MRDLEYRFADKMDLKGIENLLHHGKLPYEDIEKHLANFLLVERDHQIVGVVGLEIVGRAALLRSLVVLKDLWSKGIATKLLEKMFDYAEYKDVKELYLLTTTARDYFLRFGFEVIDRSLVFDGIKTTGEFMYLCPDTAVCMKKLIS